MHILPYTIANTNDLITSRGGLICVAELMRRIGRAGNVAPAADNAGFIKTCVAGLPAGVSVRDLRADAASYQGAVFQYCDTHQIEYVIRAQRSHEMKAWRRERPAADWTPPARDGEAVDGQSTYRGVWALEDSKKAFTLVVQRTRTLRWRVYALAAKVVCHARRVYLKFRPEHACLVKTLLAALAPPRPPPLPGTA